MKKILTAINIEEIYLKLKENKNIEIINNDILYKEGILEILEKSLEINYLIINENIPGEIEINYLLNKIIEINKNIKIILLTEKNNIKKIKNKNNLIIIENKNNYLELIEKILKNINEKTINKKIINNEENNFLNNILEINNNKIYSIKGTNGSGKSIVSAIIAYLNALNNKKVLLIDFDTETGNIHTIFQVKRKINNIQEITNNLYFLNLNINEKIKNKINEKFDLIIFDNYKYLKNNLIIKTIYLFEGNLLEIGKLKNNKENNYLNNYLLIINKYNKNSIDENIIKKIFENKKILKINYSDKYNLLVNNFKLNIKNKYFKKEYKIIIKKMEE